MIDRTEWDIYLSLVSVSEKGLNLTFLIANFKAPGPADNEFIDFNANRGENSEAKKASLMEHSLHGFPIIDW